MADIAIILLPLLPLALWAFLTGWTPSHTEGEPLVVVPISLLSRIKMIATPMVLGLVVIVAMNVFGDANLISLAILGVIFVVLISIPISYTLTTVGIRVGKGRFRRWTEFAGVRRSATGVTLVGGQRASSYPIFLSGDRGDDDFVYMLKHLIQDSYKGRATVRDRIRSANSAG